MSSVLAVGEVAPDFALPGTTGEVHLADEVAGHRATVVAFYPLDFTGG